MPHIRSLGLFLTGFVLLVSLAACRGDKVSVDANDPMGPKYEYALHEFALLKLRANQVQELEKEKEYGQIYDELASPALKHRLSRREFLGQANCVETYLGSILEYERLNYSFERKRFGKSTQDIVSRRVKRINESIWEQMAFVWIGDDFRLNQINWVSKGVGYQRCMEELATQLEELPPPEVEETLEESSEQVAN